MMNSGGTKTMRKGIVSFLAALLAVLLTVTASAATIYPVASAGMNRLAGQQLPVDITWESEHEARMTVYAYDMFSGSDLAGLRVGDSIMIEGRLETVRSVQKNGDTYVVNEYEQNTFFFSDEYGNGTYSCMDGYYHNPSSPIGVIYLNPNIRFTCLDYLDLQNQRYRETPVVYSNYDFYDAVKKDNTHFKKNYTYALFGADNLPQVIYRYYSAIESY